MDVASSISDIVDPFNYKRTRALSAWDMTHNFVGTFRYELPLEKLTKRARFLTRGWAVSGIARASTGFPVTLAEHGDNSLEGSIPNGVNNHSLDLPDYTGSQSQFESRSAQRSVVSSIRRHSSTMPSGRPVPRRDGLSTGRALSTSTLLCSGPSIWLSAKR